jgi:hypothetical protein
MKKLLIFTILTVYSYAFSQVQSTTETNVRNYSQRVEKIVSQEKANMNQELLAVDESYKSGKINADEMQTSKQKIAEKYEKIINDRVNAERDSLDNLTKMNVRIAVMEKKDTISKSSNKVVLISGSQNSILTISSQKKKIEPKDLLKTDGLAITYAFLNLTKDKGSFNPFENNSQMRIGNSHSFEIQGRHERQIGSYISSVFIRYGLAYRSDTYMPKRPQIFNVNNQQLSLENFDLGNLRTSKLRNVYIMLPVDFQFVLNPKYKMFEGINYLDATKKQWRIGAGIYAGIRTRSIVKFKYHDENNKFQRDQFIVDSGINSFLYGAKFSISYGSLNFFIKKDLSPIFSNNANLPSKNGIQVVVDLTNLSF